MPTAKESLLLSTLQKVYKYMAIHNEIGWDRDLYRNISGVLREAMGDQAFLKWQINILNGKRRS